jgi:hypothetical protein
MGRKITSERADELTAAWDAASSTERLSMKRIQWFSAGNDTTFWEMDPSPLETKAADRIAELEAALRELVAAVDEQGDGLDPTVRLVQAMRDAKSHLF